MSTTTTPLSHVTLYGHATGASTAAPRLLLCRTHNQALSTQLAKDIDTLVRNTVFSSQVRTTLATSAGTPLAGRVNFCVKFTRGHIWVKTTEAADLNWRPINSDVRLDIDATAATILRKANAVYNAHAGRNGCSASSSSRSGAGATTGGTGGAATVEDITDEADDGFAPVDGLSADTTLSPRGSLAASPRGSPHGSARPPTTGARNVNVSSNDGVTAQLREMETHLREELQRAFQQNAQANLAEITQLRTQLLQTQQQLATQQQLHLQQQLVTQQAQLTQQQQTANEHVSQQVNALGGRFNNAITTSSTQLQGEIQSARNTNADAIRGFSTHLSTLTENLDKLNQQVQALHQEGKREVGADAHPLEEQIQALARNISTIQNQLSALQNSLPTISAAPTSQTTRALTQEPRNKVLDQHVLSIQEQSPSAPRGEIGLDNENSLAKPATAELSLTAQAKIDDLSALLASLQPKINQIVQFIESNPSQTQEPPADNSNAPLSQQIAQQLQGKFDALKQDLLEVLPTSQSNTATTAAQTDSIEKFDAALKALNDALHGTTAAVQDAQNSQERSVTGAVSTLQSEFTNKLETLKDALTQQINDLIRKEGKKEENDAPNPLVSKLEDVLSSVNTLSAQISAFQQRLGAQDAALKTEATLTTLLTAPKVPNDNNPDTSSVGVSDKPAPQNNDGLTAISDFLTSLNLKLGEISSKLPSTSSQALDSMETVPFQEGLAPINLQEEAQKETQGKLRELEISLNAVKDGLAANTATLTQLVQALNARLSLLENNNPEQSQQRGPLMRSALPQPQINANTKTEEQLATAKERLEKLQEQLDTAKAQIKQKEQDLGDTNTLNLDLASEKNSLAEQLKELAKKQAKLQENYDKLLGEFTTASNDAADKITEKTKQIDQLDNQLAAANESKEDNTASLLEEISSLKKEIQSLQQDKAETAFQLAQVAILGRDLLEKNSRLEQTKAELLALLENTPTDSDKTYALKTIQEIQEQVNTLIDFNSVDGVFNLDASSNLDSTTAAATVSEQ